MSNRNKRNAKALRGQFPRFRAYGRMRDLPAGSVFWFSGWWFWKPAADELHTDVGFGFKALLADKTNHCHWLRRNRHHQGVKAMFSGVFTRDQLKECIK